MFLKYIGKTGHAWSKITFSSPKDLKLLTRDRSTGDSLKQIWTFRDHTLRKLDITLLQLFKITNLLREKSLYHSCGLRLPTEIRAV